LLSLLNVEDVKLLYGVGLAVLCLIVAAPSIGYVVSPSRGESFSELWLLGENHMIDDYPYNVMEGENYTVYLGVGNHMGSLEYYVVRVKFRNSTEPLPDTFNETASSLPSLFEYRFLVADNDTWERKITFSFSSVSRIENDIVVGDLRVDGRTFSVNKSSAWNQVVNEFGFQLFFELWRYNRLSSSIEFHNRFVGLRLNMTTPQF
jgi:hypothetical protein